MKLSLGEKLLRELVRVKFPNEKLEYNIKPDSLINPNTGYKLELDIFIPNIHLAFEFQGSQHGEYYQSFKDEIKKIWCENNGIKLKIIWWDRLLDLCKEYKINKKSSLYKKILKYTKKSKHLDKKLSKSPNYYGVVNGRFALSCVEFKKRQAEEIKHAKYKSLIKSGMPPQEAIKFL